MVDSLVSCALEKLNRILGDEVASLVGVADEIESLSSTFTLIQVVLEDAESRRVKDRAVKIWLEKVKDIAYDLDDILDEWPTEVLRSQVPDEGDGSCFSKKEGKRFLLVLDDIWSEDSEKWDKLKLPFQVGAFRSRIIITTRSEKVAIAMGRAHIYKLAVLSDDDCWLSFSCRALEHRSAEERSDLEEFGRDIVALRNCIEQ
ncbi:putative disease resistance protein RGA1 [Magnolia sinica]|uniref:putative disease resistance protein RGA1 n=1 Tax=Magnolia sinica TaxID=86752 RepID=UPI00265AF916|nr:putative disease resistance protein RGA1 [Magnolia sinica]